MRREDKEIKDRTVIEAILDKSDVCRIGFSQNNQPYIVPMIFVYKDNCIYLHSANEGRKIDIIRQNNRICIEVDTMDDIIVGKKACLFGVKYKSVIGFGKASFISSLDEKKAILDLLVQKYSEMKQWDYFKDALEKISVIKIELDDLTGKESK